MPEYKLTYGDARGLAEPIRQIFAHAKVEYQDIRLPTSDMPLSDEKKKELGLPWGQIPILEVDGKVYGQSNAIARYLAKKYNLVGKNEFESLKCDEIVDAFKDYGHKFSALYPFLFYPKSDQTKMAELLKTIVEVDTPKDLARFNALLEKNPSGFFVGNSLTWADILVAAGLTQIETVFQIQILNDYPALKKLVAQVENSPGIKEWIANRPKTQF